MANLLNQTNHAHCQSCRLWASSLQEATRDVDPIPELVRKSLQQPTALEVVAVLGADRQERSDERRTQANAYRPSPLASQAGDKIPLLMSKLRSGTFFPMILETRRRVVQAAGRA